MDVDGAMNDDASRDAQPAKLRPILRYPHEGTDAIQLVAGDLERLKAGSHLNDNIVEWLLK